MSSGIVPIIDFSPFLSGDQGAKAAVAKELHAAATGVGFFMIKGYQSEISQETVEQAFKQVSAARIDVRGWGLSPRRGGQDAVRGTRRVV